MIAAAIVALAAVAAAPPTYVVERVVTRNGASTRLSVFRNGVAVLARKGAGEKPDEGGAGGAGGAEGEEAKRAKAR